MHRLGLRNYDYLIDAAEIIQKHWDVSASSSA
jgi:hypothetical protein